MTEEGEQKENQEAQENQESEPGLTTKASFPPPKPRLKIILFSVLGLVLVGGLVFGGYKLGQKQAKPGPTPTPIVVATPTPDPATNRKTYIYQNEGRSFQFKYPHNWEIIPGGSSANSSPGFGIENSFVKQKMPDIGLEGIGSIIPGIVIEDVAYSYYHSTTGVNPNGPYASIENYINSIKSSNNQQIISQENIILGANSVTKLLVKSNITEYEYLIRYPDSSLFIIVMALTGELASARVDENNNVIDYRKVADQILSTFKFLDDGSGERVQCVTPRPEVCTEECIVNPPYICGSDGESYCTVCAACADSSVEWYTTQSDPCKVQ